MRGLGCYEYHFYSLVMDFNQLLNEIKVKMQGGVKGTPWSLFHLPCKQENPVPPPKAKFQNRFVNLPAGFGKWDFAISENEHNPTCISIRFCTSVT